MLSEVLTYVASYRDSFIESFHWNFNAFRGVSYLASYVLLLFYDALCYKQLQRYNKFNYRVSVQNYVASYTVQLLAMSSLSFIWLDVLSCVGALQSRKHASLMKCVRENMYHWWDTRIPSDICAGTHASLGMRVWGTFYPGKHVSLWHR